VRQGSKVATIDDVGVPTPSNFRFEEIDKEIQEAVGSFERIIIKWLSKTYRIRLIL
jgi:hypothetical protein